MAENRILRSAKTRSFLYFDSIHNCNTSFNGLALTLIGCSSFSFPLYFQPILCAILVKQRERSASNLDRNVICEMHCGVKADRHCRHIVCLCLHPANKTRLRTNLSLRFADTNAISLINQTISIFS